MLGSSKPEFTRVVLLFKEYPPNVYGGAGVHVEYLSQALATLLKVEVRCFGDQAVDDGAIDAFARSLVMAKDRLDAQLVHCHTWYTDMGGVIANSVPAFRQGWAGAGDHAF